jgi:MoxR-like ATPase
MAAAARGDASAEESLSASIERIEGLAGRLNEVRREIAKVIVGQDRVVEEILITLIAGGHALLEGVPGLAKTLLVSTVARITSLTFQRIQFTPDLMPADITGTQVIQSVGATGERRLVFRPGPIFAGVVLADEINRSPPKTQAALLEAMQERQVTAGGARHPLPAPFFVLATQNPIEQEGTYPLPEAQRDRFLFHIKVDYPTLEEEHGIIQRTAGTVIPPEAPAPATAAAARRGFWKGARGAARAPTPPPPAPLPVVGPMEDPSPILSAREILLLQRILRALPVSDYLARFATALVRSTRPAGRSASDEVKSWVAWGAGPRAAQALIFAAKARALLAGRFAVTRADLRSIALPALRHRVIPNFRAEAEGVGADEIVGLVLDAASIASPHPKASIDARTKKLLRL